MKNFLRNLVYFSFLLIKFYFFKQTNSQTIWESVEVQLCKRPLRTLVMFNITKLSAHHRIRCVLRNSYRDVVGACANGNRKTIITPLNASRGAKNIPVWFVRRICFRRCTQTCYDNVAYLILIPSWRRGPLNFIRAIIVAPTNSVTWMTRGYFTLERLSELCVIIFDL